MVNIGDKLKVYYGPTHESKVTYEAKVIEIDSETSPHLYLVHYTGWNNRYDEWISPSRIAENLSASTKAKRLKSGTPSQKVIFLYENNYDYFLSHEGQFKFVSMIFIHLKRYCEFLHRVYFDRNER